MIDAIIQATSAEEFFAHGNVENKVLEEVRKDARPYLALVVAPREWDIAKHPSLPFFGAYKTNDRDNEDMPLPTHWLLILSAPGREELVVLPWEENDHKLPPATPSLESPPPPGTQPKVTYTISESWREVSHSRIPEAPGKWLAALHAGDFLSNRISVDVLNKRSRPAIDGNGVQSVPGKKPSEYPETERLRFRKTPGHPMVSAPGVAISKPVSMPASKDGKQGRPLILNAAFAFSEPPLAGSEFLTLHLLLTAPEIPGGRLHKVSVPTAFLERADGVWKGWFTLDLDAMFRGPSGIVQVPPTLYVTAIRGGYIGQPHNVLGE